MGSEIVSVLVLEEVSVVVEVLVLPELSAVFVVNAAIVGVIVAPGSERSSFPRSSVKVTSKTICCPTSAVVNL